MVERRQQEHHDKNHRNMSNMSVTRQSTNPPMVSESLGGVGEVIIESIFFLEFIAAWPRSVPCKPRVPRRAFSLSR